MKQKGFDREAIHFFKESMQNSEENSDQYIRAGIELAGSYIELGEYELTIECLNKLNEPVRFLFGRQSRFYLLILERLMKAYFFQGNFEHFLAFANCILEILEESSEKNSTTWFQTIELISDAHFQRG